MTRGDQAIAVTLEHRERTVDEVAQTVGEFGVVTRLKAGVGPVAIGADVEFTDDVEAEGVEAPFIDDREGIDDVARALADLGAVLLPPAVDEELFGQRQAHRLEHDGPEHRVELENVLADDVQVGGPEGELRVWSGELRNGQAERAAHEGVALGGGDA